MKRKIAAIFAADIAGYSRLVAEDEEETLRRLKAYREVTDDFIAKAGGRIFNTAGDAVLAEFPSAVEAVRCAIDIQESLRTRNSAFPPSRHMSFRIGITIGDVVERDGDLLGDGVNIAARLEGLAEVGGICVSRSVYEAVANKLSVRFADLGAQQVKNIPTPVHAYMIGRQPGEVVAAGSGSSASDFVLGLTRFFRFEGREPSSNQFEMGKEQSWTRLAAAWDSRTLLETLIALIALTCLIGASLFDKLFLSNTLLNYITVGLLSSIVVLMTLLLIDGRLKLRWSERFATAVVYGAFSALALTTGSILRSVGLDGYVADYASRTDLPMLFGCIGASVTLRRHIRAPTVFLTLTFIALLLALRYAVATVWFHTAVFLIPMPVVLIALLIASSRSRISVVLDVAVVIAAWLGPVAVALGFQAVTPLLPDLVQSLFAFGGPAMIALPTALAWPALRFARSRFDLVSPSSKQAFGLGDRVWMGAFAGSVAILVGYNLLSQSTNLYRCTMKAELEACGAIIDSPSASAGERVAALERRAGLFYGSEGSRQSIADWTKLVELDPRNPERYISRAEKWREIESYDQAAADLDTALALQPDNPKVYKARFELQKSRGDDRQAAAELDQLIRVEPSGENFVLRAESYEKLANYDHALADYTSAIRRGYKPGYSLWGGASLSPFDARYQIVKKVASNPGQVTKYLDEFVAKEPTYAENYRIRAEARDEKEIEKNLADYDQAIFFKPDDDDLRLARAALRERNGNFAGAVEDYDRAVKADPKSAKALYGRGLAKSGKGDRTGAAADISAARAIDPDIGR